MAATITVVAGPKNKVFNLTDVNQARIITAIERSGLSRDPDSTGTDLNDFDYFNFWLESQYRDLVFRTERQAAQRAIVNDPDLLT